MNELLPCNQCGKSNGYGLTPGSTYRWWNVHCAACGAEFGECAADRQVNLQNQPIPERWEWADSHWNECNAHAQGLRDRIDLLEKEVVDQDAIRKLVRIAQVAGHLCYWHVDLSGEDQETLEMVLTDAGLSWRIDSVREENKAAFKQALAELRQTREQQK